MVKKIFFAWRVDIKKIITGVSLPIAIFLTFSIFLSSTIYETDTGKTYNAITVFLNFTGDEIANIGVSQNDVLFQGGHFWIYAPLVVLLPLIPILVMERAGGSRRYQILRTGKIPFAIEKMLITLLAGGMVALCGFLLFSVYVSVLFPAGEEAVTAVLFVGKAFKYFLYGAVLAVLGYIVAIFIKNVYLVFCIPFIANYLWEMCLGYLASYQEQKRIKDIMAAAQSMSVFWFDGLSDRMTRYSILFHALLVVMAVTIYSCHLKRKTDCGD